MMNWSWIIVKSQSWTVVAHRGNGGYVGESQVGQFQA